jgi:hypothetical protein
LIIAKPQKAGQTIAGIAALSKGPELDQGFQVPAIRAPVLLPGWASAARSR